MAYGDYFTPSPLNGSEGLGQNYGIDQYEWNPDLKHVYSLLQNQGAIQPGQFLPARGVGIMGEEHQDESNALQSIGQSPEFLSFLQNRYGTTDVGMRNNTDNIDSRPHPLDKLIYANDGTGYKETADVSRGTHDPSGDFWEIVSKVAPFVGGVYFGGDGGATSAAAGGAEGGGSAANGFDAYYSGAGGVDGSLAGSGVTNTTGWGSAGAAGGSGATGTMEAISLTPTTAASTFTPMEAIGGAGVAGGAGGTAGGSSAGTGGFNAAADSQLASSQLGYAPSSMGAPGAAGYVGGAATPVAGGGGLLESIPL